MYFEYGQKEIDYLSKKDKKLGALIDEMGMIKRKFQPDLFAAIMDSIVSQQISTKAADTVFTRLSALCEITPQGVFGADISDIQKCGMSMRKAQYIKSCAQAAISGQVDFEKIKELPDEEFIKVLSSINGVGVWTAQMLLIFSLNRMDVLSYGDLGIRRGMMRLYNLKELPRDKFDKYKKRYSPYGSVAALYLWALSSIAP